jgi:hypothetical protein
MAYSLPPLVHTRKAGIAQLLRHDAEEAKIQLVIHLPARSAKRELKMVGPLGLEPRTKGL